MDELKDTIETDQAPRFLLLPLSQVFIVLSAILVVPIIWALVFTGARNMIQILMFLTVVPPFVTLLWLGAGLAALAQWMRLRRICMDREKRDA